MLRKLDSSAIGRVTVIKPAQRAFGHDHGKLLRMDLTMNDEELVDKAVEEAKEAVQEMSAKMKAMQFVYQAKIQQQIERSKATGREV